MVRVQQHVQHVLLAPLLQLKPHSPEAIRARHVEDSPRLLAWTAIRGDQGQTRWRAVHIRFAWTAMHPPRPAARPPIPGVSLQLQHGLPAGGCSSWAAAAVGRRRFTCTTPIAAPSTRTTSTSNSSCSQTPGPYSCDDDGLQLRSPLWSIAAAAVRPYGAPSCRRARGFTAAIIPMENRYSRPYSCDHPDGEPLRQL